METDIYFLLLVEVKDTFVIEEVRISKAVIWC